jgi:hypothetical protein
VNHGPNREAFQKVLEAIEANPGRHDQQLFGYRTWCGTTLCIGGYAALTVGGGEPVWQERFDGEILTGVITPDGRHEHPETYAREVLGLTPSQGCRLFFEFDNQRALDIVRAYAQGYQGEEGTEW